MRILVLFILINSPISDVNKIAKVNSLKKQAEKAFNQGEYDAAISSFRTLTDSLGINEYPILLNLANAYFHQKDTTNAQQYYSRVLSSEDAQLRSLAYQQMGIINKQKNEFDKASMADLAPKYDPPIPITTKTSALS